VRGGADEFDDSAFHIRQQNVLLCLVEAVNLVDEENGRLAGVFQAVDRRGQDASHVGDIGFHAAEAFEFTAGLARDDVGEGSLAGAGWAVKNQGLNPVGFDGPAQELARAKNVGLADVLVEGARAHSGGERAALGKGCRRGGFFLLPLCLRDRK